jgi:hypothetical protein
MLPAGHCSIPASTWHRFQRVLEPTATVLAVLTSQPLVEGASVAWRSVQISPPRPCISRSPVEHLHVQVFERGAAGSLEEVFAKSA